MTVPARQVRAVYTADTITVYQAYSPSIADEAVRLGRFGPGFRRGRMTWIKPSFLWMMYRSGYATKPGQERVLAIQITRQGFEWALGHAALSHVDPAVHADYEAWRLSLSMPVRVQWDPERDLFGRALDHRAIQVGLSGQAVERYVDEWIVGVVDVTDVARSVAELVDAGQVGAATDSLPVERPYPLSAAIATSVGASVRESPHL
jgi:Domain of unknown function (DUF4291)